MASDFSALGQNQNVFHIYTEVSDRALNLRVPQQYLDRAKIIRGLVNDGRLGSPHGMRTVILTRQANSRDPLVDKACILPRADVGSVVGAVGEGIIRKRTTSELKPFKKAGARRGMIG